jgi:hypothetical protein
VRLRVHFATIFRHRLFPVFDTRVIFEHANEFGKRVAFAKTKQSRQVDRLIDSLPEPPVGP